MSKATYQQQLTQERASTWVILNRIARDAVAGSDQTPKLERLQSKLQRIDEALQRLITGQYGKCLSCQSTIAAERLYALPYAEYCFPCQRQFEDKLALTANNRSV